MEGWRHLRAHDVPFNVLCTVNAANQAHGREVYRFFREAGIRFIQFTPIVEREPDAETKAIRFWLARPSVLDRPEPNTQVTPWTVEPEAYGDFLIAIYEEWVRKDVGSVFVMNFEWALNAWLGEGSPVCIFARTCGRAVAIEHDGSVFACDHYVYPEYRLGNVQDRSLGELVSGNKEKNMRLIMKMLEAYPDLAFESLSVEGHSGCSEFTGTAIAEPGRMSWRRRA